MKKIKLKRFKQSLTPEDLRNNRVSILDTEHIGEEVDVEPLRLKLAKKIVEIRNGTSHPADLDRELAWDLFECFKGVPNLYLTDICFWQWISVEPLKTFTQFRRARDATALRHGKKFESMTEKGDIAAIIGASSLNGQNRQVVMRLFLAARDLGSAALTQSALDVQDRLVSTFERQIGMNATTARGIIQGVEKSDSVMTQKRVTRLNAISETILLDYLDSNEIKTLVSEI